MNIFKRKIMLIFGTRPEAIKMAPLYHEIKRRQLSGVPIELSLCVTAQHRQMLDQVLDLFKITPDFDLNIMAPGQSLSHVTSKVLDGIGLVLQKVKPDIVLVHGDTTTSFAASLAAYYQKILVAHVEAGLRTGDKYSPYPEEMNRLLTGAIADIHFAPTKKSRQNLLDENIDSSKIFVTGNTVIDALKMTVRHLQHDKSKLKKYQNQFSFLNNENKIVLITGHRRENFGAGFESLCAAIKELANNRKDIDFVYPVHLNPNVEGPVRKNLGGIKNIHLLKPLEYEPFVYLMMTSAIIVTDSGGIQEEAPSLGKPVLVTRGTTERPEALEAGTVKLVGTDKEMIISGIEILLDDQEQYLKMSQAVNPFGDGMASVRIVDCLLK